MPRGYIAKYITGEVLEQGIYGENPIFAAQKVTAWAMGVCLGYQTIPANWRCACERLSRAETLKARR